MQFADDITDMIEERATTPTPAGPRNGEDTDMQGYEGNHTGGESAAQQTRTNGTTLPSASQTGGGGGQASQSRFSRPSTSVYLDRELFSVYTEEGRGPDYEESSGKHLHSRHQPSPTLTLAHLQMTAATTSSSGLPPHAQQPKSTPVAPFTAASKPTPRSNDAATNTSNATRSS